MRTRCPGMLALDRYLEDPSASPWSEHVAGCPDCAARVSQLQGYSQTFDARGYPATVERVVEQYGRRRWWRRLIILTPIPVLAAALLVIRVQGDHSNGLRGGALSLTAYETGADRLKPISDGQSVAPDATLAITVLSAKPCALTLVSVDANGQITPLVREQVLAGRSMQIGARLDGAIGPERFFALCGPRPLSDADLAPLRAASPEGVRAPRLVPGDVAQATLLVEKAR